jgi:hypothetical protein
MGVPGIDAALFGGRVTSVLRWIQLVVLLSALAALPAGCSRIADVRQARAERRTLEEVARRMRSLERIEGGGHLEVQYAGSTLTFPFVFRLVRGGALEVETETLQQPWSELGRVRLVSDARGTCFFGAGEPRQLPCADSLGVLLRPLLLSLFGGGDALVHWLVASRCDPEPETRCSGLEVSLRMSSRRKSVERWTIRDPVRGVAFTGFVHSWSAARAFPTIITGMIHPYEIGVSVRYEEAGLAEAGPAVKKAGRDGNPGGACGFE